MSRPLDVPVLDPAGHRRGETVAGIVGGDRAGRPARDRRAEVVA